MTFDLAEYEATLRRLDAGLEHLSRLVHQLPAATASAAGRWFLTDAGAASLAQVGATLTAAGHDLIAKLKEVLRGAVAPIRFFGLAEDWTQVRGLATSFADELQPVALSVGYYWQGRAADAYATVIPAQIAAAVRIGAMADKTQTALMWSAAAGCTFYLGLLVVVGQLIIAFIGVLVALESVVFSWAAIGLAVEQAGFSAAEIGGLVGLLAAALTSQYVQLRNLQSEAADTAAFPHHHWPSSLTDRYTDATVTDGDAEWSRAQR